MTVTDYLDWNTPQAHATAIAATGAPLLALPTSAYAPAQQSLAPGASFNSPNLTLGQIGYDIFVNVANNSSAVAVSNVQVHMQWFDLATGFVVARQRWFIQAGPSGGAQHIAGSGPTRGSYLVITVTNAAASGDTVLVNITFVQNSRVNLRDDWRTTVWPGAMPGTPATANSDIAGLGIFSCQATNLGIGASTSFVLPLFAGTILLRMNSTSAAADAEFAIQTAADTVFGNQTIYDSVVSATGKNNVQMALPRCNCVLTATNNNAAVKSLNATAVALDY